MERQAAGQTPGDQQLTPGFAAREVLKQAPRAQDVHRAQSEGSIPRGAWAPPSLGQRGVCSSPDAIIKVKTVLSAKLLRDRMMSTPQGHQRIKNMCPKECGTGRGERKSLYVQET